MLGGVGRARRSIFPPLEGAAAPSPTLKPQTQSDKSQRCFIFSLKMMHLDALAELEWKQMDTEITHNVDEQIDTCCIRDYLQLEDSD